ncbi:MAG: elongation factor P [Deltaproteobacteria bacterium]|nr:elongation factor P [Deltaproteobacteria bacterium]
MKANDIRKGSIILHNGAPYKVMDFHHHTPGNLRAMVQTKLRNLISGSQTEVRFSATEDVQEADVFLFPATFLYADGEGYHFMNSESYEQIQLSRELIGDGIYYLQDEMKVDITTYNGEPIAVQLPQTVVLTIEETEPEMRGATATNSPKPAKTETGLSLTVPQFIKKGDRIVVNTAEGKYLSRAE